MGSSALLTLALAAVTSALLRLGIWPLAAVGLALLVAGRREWPTLAADAIVFAGLAAHADPLWVAALIVATLVSREHHPLAIVILLVASLASTFFALEWTILVGLLAIVAIVRALRGLRHAPAYQR